MAAKMAKIGEKNEYWLYYGCRKGNLGHYYFHIAGLLRGQYQPVDQVTAAALLNMAKNAHYLCAILRNQAYYTFSQVGILTLNLTYFYTFPVNSQNTFLSADFCKYKCLVLIQKCSRTIVYFK